VYAWCARVRAGCGAGSARRSGQEERARRASRAGKQGIKRGQEECEEQARRASRVRKKSGQGEWARRASRARKKSVSDLRTTWKQRQERSKVLHQIWPVPKRRRGRRGVKKIVSYLFQIHRSDEHSRDERSLPAAAANECTCHRRHCPTPTRPTLGYAASTLVQCAQHLCSQPFGDTRPPQT
jgi:hypothetical protein